MLEFNLEKAVEYYQEERNITEACKKHCKELGIDYSEKYRNRLSRHLRNTDITEDVSETVTKGYEVATKGFSAVGEDGKMMNIEDYCRHYNLDISKVKSYKLISHSGTPFYNIVFYTSEEQEVANFNDYLEELVKTHIRPVKVGTKFHKLPDFFDRVVYSDVHIGMDVQGKNGDPLYDGKWDKEELMRRLSIMVSHIKKFKKSNYLIIDELGDFLDGLGGQTTRKGHELPQNMNDKEVFDLALLFKISLVDSLVDDYDTIVCNDITNDNHSGHFSYFVSSAVKQILEQKYPNIVTVNTRKRFIEHYSVGKHTFLISHGKDIGENKFGFKPKTDAVQVGKIDQYCKEHNLYNGNFIEFSKGDSHQSLMDDSTSTDFSYYNYPAFSPPSNWAKTNFGRSRQGFNFFNISKDENIKISIPYWF